jgi:hypothetical protein
VPLVKPRPKQIARLLVLALRAMAAAGMSQRQIADAQRFHCPA